MQTDSDDHYAHTISIDGEDDFNSNEKLPTTTDGYTARVAWDDEYLYFGLSGPDLANSTPNKRLVVYLRDHLGPHTDMFDGVAYGTQKPLLYFDVDFHISILLQDGSPSAMVVNGSAWEAASWNLSESDVGQNGTFLEARVPWSYLDNPEEIKFASALVDSESGEEKTYAGVPYESFQDGDNPFFTMFYRFEIGGTTAPFYYTPIEGT